MCLKESVTDTKYFNLTLGQIGETFYDIHEKTAANYGNNCS